MNTAATKGTKKLLVVIVNFRTPDYVTDCLASLLPELCPEDSAVVVVDNDSGDNSLDLIRFWLGRQNTEIPVNLVQSGCNLGFSYGNNIGIRSQKAHYYLLLNSDTLIRSGAIKRLLETAFRYPDAGLISPRLEWLDGLAQESCFRVHTPLSEMLSAAKAGILDSLFSRFVVAMPAQKNMAYPKWTSFACVLIRDTVFRDIGLLDEGYFMYFEDAEFCVRAGEQGWKIVHDPDAHVVHLRGGSSSVKEQVKLKKRVPAYYYESRARFFSQQYGRPGLTLANILWWFGRFFSKGQQVLLGRSDKAEIDRRWLDIWINWKAPMAPSSSQKNK